MERIHRFVFEHRRLLAATFTGLAVLATLSAVRSSPDGVGVLVASHDLPSGRVLDADDVRLARLPPDARPAHALIHEEDAVGRRIAGPMRSGEAMTDFRVLAPDTLTGYGDDAVLTAVRVADAEGLTGVHVGDRVDVVAVDPAGESKARVVARSVEVVTVPPPAEGDRVAPIGIVTTEKVALALASAALESRFSLLSAARQAVN